MCKFVNWADYDDDDVELVRTVPSSYYSSYSSKFLRDKTFLMKTRPLHIVAESPGCHSNRCGSHLVIVYDSYCEPTHSDCDEYQSPSPPVIVNYNNIDLQNSCDGCRSADTDIRRVAHCQSNRSTNSGGGIVRLQKPQQSFTRYSHQGRGALPVVRDIPRGGHGRSVRFEDEI